MKSFENGFQDRPAVSPECRRKKTGPLFIIPSAVETRLYFLKCGPGLFPLNFNFWFYYMLEKV